ncbi:MAG: RecX family transcriptional regulator [Anaerolineae bacterium]|nr:RecX family transcriptional regulator [Anaerolineae bacterium]
MARRITALEPQRRSGQRLNVYLDGDFAFGLAIDVAANLHVGDVVTDEEIATLRADDEREQAREKALNFLSYRPRSIAEVRQNLEQGDFSETTITDVLERLGRVRLLDDLAFSSFWIDNRTRFRPRGRRALVQELRQKGVPAAIIEEALNGFDEEAAAEQCAQAQARRIGQLPPEMFRRRLGERLARRGFSYDLIRDILARHPDPSSIESEET